MRTKDMRDEIGSPAQLSLDQREAVLEEMNRILADPAFNGSKRCVALFRYLVNCALNGEQNEFKERTLGIEVFGRDPSYDSQADPIVRVTANEIRKRLGQCYYEEQGSRHNVKIRLVRGGYLPEFDFSGSDQPEAEEADPLEMMSPTPLVLPPAEIPHLGEVQASVPFNLRRKRLLWTGTVILVIAAVASFYHYGHPVRSRQDMVWEPLLRSDKPLMVCVADDPSLAGSGGEERAQVIANASASHQTPVVPNAPDSIPATPFVDMTTANQVSSWFVAHGRKVFLQRASTATLHMFRQGPAVLIGGFDNPWSLILLKNLRYSIRVDPTTHDKWIEDAQNPSKREWTIKSGLQFNDSYVDYAIITRFLDSETDNWIVGVSGLGFHGVRAASELITDDSYAKSIPSAISSTSTIQTLLKTSVINGTSSPPQVVAVYPW